ncbi:MAG: hypothetical protein ABEH78_03925 [Haloferacaceae archaeon]
MDPDAVGRAFDPAVRETFERRVAEQADRIAEDIRSGRLDADAFAIGLELEAYATDADGRLVTVPDAVFAAADCTKELGGHNVEVNTPATRFDPEGLSAQTRELDERVRAVATALREGEASADAAGNRTPADAAGNRTPADAAGRRLALDAMWTIPPRGGSAAYLNATREADGLTIAEEMRSSTRYHALDNEVLQRAGGTIDLDLPGVDLTLDTILVESLTTSIQPHLQVPRAAAIPAYHDVAVRTMAPLLALSTNSPFLPADLYADAAPGVIDETYHEHRVPVFERSINAGRPAGEGNVRVPEDMADATEIAERVVEDPTYAPSLADEANGEGGGGAEGNGGERAEADGLYADRIPEFDRKRGVHWRWIRAVVGGQPVGTDDGASVRLEYRPLPTQPTVRDNVSLAALTVGLLRGLIAADHPLRDLPWTAARDAFYRVVREGPDAELAWLTAEGERTADPDAIYDEVFAYARRGLRESGLDDATADEYLAPIERRRASGPPSAWKKARARAAVDDGATVPGAIERAQRAYLDRAGPDREPFADW